MKEELLTNELLSEFDRRAYIKTISLIKEGFLNSFSKANVTTPIWFEKEFS